MTSGPMTLRRHVRAQRAADLEAARTSPLAAQAVQAVGVWLDEEGRREEIRKLMDQYQFSQTPWWAPVFHLAIGTGLRNHLRDSGFGEDELGVVNLDNVYIEMIEREMSKAGIE
ncbi:hypothetical protein LCGC14_1636110 [marine sediment metagenome]|uniref:Uncharacterized protein n=1 Tax=marine sediment metagenome TaxID=412755 RepID=A0A0F9I157_9ZZZZ